MKVVVWLDNPIRAFQLQEPQLLALRERYPQHQLLAVHDREAFLRHLADAGVVLVWQFSAAWYALAPKLKLVATPAAGREWVEPDPAGRVRVSRGSFHGKIMAETLLAMMLFRTRRLAACLADQRARRYDRDSYSKTRRLAGQRALIVGYGPLGRECGALLRSVGVRVVGVKRNAAVEPGPAEAVYPLERLPALLPQADHVVSTLPGDTGAEHLFGEEMFRQMQPTAAFYSLGRGNTVDEAALVSALEGGRLGHAFLDVFEREPLPSDSPLWTTQNLTLMPHASAISSEYLELWLDELGPELEAR
jgi:D-2-hydroxyacid dehydrogenase (NADP+)